MNKSTHKPRPMLRSFRMEKLARTFLMVGTGINQHPEIWEFRLRLSPKAKASDSQISGCWLIPVPAMRKVRASFPIRKERSIGLGLCVDLFIIRKAQNQRNQRYLLFKLTLLVSPATNVFKNLLGT